MLNNKERAREPRVSLARGTATIANDKAKNGPLISGLKNHYQALQKLRFYRLLGNPAASFPNSLASNLLPHEVFSATLKQDCKLTKE